MRITLGKLTELLEQQEQAAEHHLTMRNQALGSAETIRYLIGQLNQPEPPAQDTPPLAPAPQIPGVKPPPVPPPPKPVTRRRSLLQTVPSDATPSV